MYRHLWKTCFILQLTVLTYSVVKCNSCDLTELQKIDGYCTAEVSCIQDIDFDVKTWNCIEHTNYVVEYDYRYASRKSYTRKVTTYDEEFYLRIDIKNPLEIISLGDYIKYCTHLTLENGYLIAIPQDILQMGRLEELNISGNNIGAVNLNMFLSLSSLKELVLKQNNINTIENTELQDTTNFHEISKLQSIDLSYNYITNLPNNFVSRFVQLQHLNLSHNSIGNIGLLTFEGVVKLQTLDMSYNKLHELGHALARFSDLEKLIISHNNISQLSTHNFVPLSNLVALDASCNGINIIEEFAFQILTKLSYLDLSNNNLVTINNQLFVNNINLQTIFLTNNKIKSIDQNSFDKVQLKEFNILNNSLIGTLQKNTFRGVEVLELNLSGGNLTSIDNYAFNGMSVLMVLNLSSNSISNLSYSAFSNLTSLDVLDLSNNFIKDFYFDSKNLTHIKKLYARNNKIEKITKDVFENLLALIELDLSYNKISVIEPHSFLKLNNITLFDITNTDFVNTLENRTLEGLMSLEKLDMSKAKTTHFQNGSFTGLTSLITVNYTFGQLTRIEYNAFLGTGSIEKLILSNNKLQQFCVNTSTIDTIEEIYLDNNLIRNITNDTFSHLTLLRVLNLANNEIVKLNSDVFRHLNAITHMDLSSNAKMVFAGNPFFNLSRLHIVLLKNVRGIVSFANDSASIEILNLKSCGINDINPISLYNVQRLSYLNLSMNEISTIDRNSFKNITTLVSLDLSLNKITYIQPGSFKFVENLRNLNLFGNNIASIQFGVFDGIEIMNHLNLSRNVLSTFDVKLLPDTEMLSLDDNVITDIDIEAFLETNLTGLSVGGNQLSCKTLAKLKVSKYSEEFKRVVTANKLDFHSENVNGISCQTAENSIPNVQTKNVSEVPFINISPLVATLRNILEKLDESINVITKITNTSEKSKNNEDTLVNILKNIVVTHNSSQTNNYNDLHRLTEINNNSNVQLTEIKKYLMQLATSNKNLNEYKGISNTNDKIDNENLRHEFRKMLQEENDALREEFKEALSSISKSTPVQESLIANEKTDDSKYVLYFMAVCLAIMLSVYVGKITFHQILKSRRSSISQMTNSIEME